MAEITYFTMSLPDGDVRAYIFPRSSPEQVVREIDRPTVASAARAAQQWIKVEYGQRAVRPF